MPERFNTFPIRSGARHHSDAHTSLSLCHSLLSDSLKVEGGGGERRRRGWQYKRAHDLWVSVDAQRERWLWKRVIKKHHLLLLTCVSVCDWVRIDSHISTLEFSIPHSLTFKTTGWASLCSTRTDGLTELFLSALQERWLCIQIQDFFLTDSKTYSDKWMSGYIFTPTSDKQWQTGRLWLSVTGFAFLPAAVFFPSFACHNCPFH